MAIDENAACCLLQDLLIDKLSVGLPYRLRRRRDSLYNLIYYFILLIDKLPAALPSAHALSLFQIQCIQSLMDPAREEILSYDAPSLSGDGLHFLLHPHS
jgi:hypothetical protein